MIALALGLPGMGKTQALQDYVARHAPTHRFLVVDRVAEWNFLSPRWRGQRWRSWTPSTLRLTASLGLGHLSVEGSPWTVEAPPPETLDDAWLGTLPPTGVVRFGHPWEGYAVAELACRLGDCAVVDDELDLVALQAGWPRNPLRAVVHRGRHLPNARGEVGQVHLLGAARRAQSLHIDVTALCDVVWVFRLRGGRTLARLAEDDILEEGAACPCGRHEDELHHVREMPPYSFKLWRSNGASTWGVLPPYHARARTHGQLFGSAT